jgi:drug/metabolite transporter (DMT)-like permease
MVTADASRGAFLNGLTVVVVPVCAGIAGSGVKRTTWVAVAVALAGIYLLEGSGSPPSWGDFWNFASAVLFSLQVRSCLLTVACWGQYITCRTCIPCCLIFCWGARLPW